MKTSQFKTRKQRIQNQNAKKKQMRKRKVVSYVLAGALATSAFITVNVTSKEAAKGLYTVQSGDTLYSLATKYDVTIRQLKEVNGLKSDLIKAGQTLKIPNGSKVGVGFTHQVASGETLYSISMKYGVTVSHLKERNGLKTELIKVGQILEISKAPFTHVVTAGDTLFSIGKKFGITVEHIKKENDLKSNYIYVGQKLTVPSNNHPQEISAPNNKKTAVSEAHYTVSPGDTLWSIAKRFHTTVNKLKKDNQMSSEYVIIGQTLKIKGSGLIKANAVVTGVVDKKSVEFQIEGEKDPIVLRVSYGTAANYDLISGAKLKIIYHESISPSLIDLVFANESFNY